MTRSKKDIPQAVLNKARELLSSYDCEVQMIGVYEQKEVYIINFHEDVTIGLPEVYLWDGKNCKTICAPDSFHILKSLEGTIY